MAYDYLDESRRFRNWPNYLAGFLGAGILICVAIVVIYPSFDKAGKRTPPVNIDAEDTTKSMQLMFPGINQPYIRSISEAKINDEAEVIGIEVEGRHRAYLIESLSYVSGHVVNDLFEDVPVTVTYCDRSDFIKVYSSQQRGAAIQLSLGGIYEDNLVLEYGGKMYDHREKTIPLLHYPFERTTWKAWKEAHPDTDIYTGDYNPPEDPLKALREINPKSTSGIDADSIGEQKPRSEAESAGNSPVEAEKPELP